MSQFGQQQPDPELVRRVAEEIAKLAGQPGANLNDIDAGWFKCLTCPVQGHCTALCAADVSKCVDVGADRVAATIGVGPITPDLAQTIDHTLLKPDATKEEVELLCAEAIKYNFKSVCINPFWVPFCARLLQGHTPIVCTVIGFPLGANDPAVKAEETRRSVSNGAREVDMVINVGALKGGMDDHVEEDVRGVVLAAGGVPVKVILETALLNDDEKIRACEICKRAGATFVKTSTGFGPGGATAGDIALMRRVVGPTMGVKASGGVRSREDAMRMIEMGATRIGASAGVKIVSRPVELPSPAPKEAEAY